MDAAPVVLRDPASRFLSVGCAVPEPDPVDLRVTERTLAIALANYRAARTGQKSDRGWFDLSDQEQHNYRAFARFAAYVLWNGK